MGCRNSGTSRYFDKIIFLWKYRVVEIVVRPLTTNLRIATLNINSISAKRKFSSLKTIVQDTIDILVLTETKLDDSFPIGQFTIPGFKLSYRKDRNARGKGVS